MPMTGLAGLLVFAAIVFAVLTLIRNSSKGRIGTGSMYCPACGIVGEPQRVTRGTMLMEAALWLVVLAAGAVFGWWLILVALGYSLWRVWSRYDACPSCRAPGMIPAGSPRAVAELVARPPQIPRQ
jgi:hypothetical protein